MKKFLKYSGCIALVLALVGMILMMATPVLVYKDGSVSSSIEGTAAIFGGDFKLAWTALLAWIFVLIAALLLIAGIILPVLKVKNPLEKAAGVINLVVVGLLIVAGIFMFITKGAFVSANKGAYGISGAILDNYNLGAGWVIGGILHIAAGIVAILPAALDLGGKK